MVGSKQPLQRRGALRPSIEKIITLAKKAHQSDDAARKVHYRRIAIAKIRNKKAVSKLFDELVDQFLARNGGYTDLQTCTSETWRCCRYGSD